EAAIPEGKVLPIEDDTSVEIRVFGDMAADVCTHNECFSWRGTSETRASPGAEVEHWLVRDRRLSGQSLERIRGPRLRIELRADAISQPGSHLFRPKRAEGPTRTFAMHSGTNAGSPHGSQPVPAPTGRSAQSRPSASTAGATQRSRSARC